MVTLMVVDFKEEYGKMVYFSVVNLLVVTFQHLVELLLEVLHRVMQINLKMDLIRLLWTLEKWYSKY
jgi:hypothetical protein